MFDSFLTSQADIWAALAREIGGELSGSAWSGFKVTASQGPWTVVLDTDGESKVPLTRFEAPFLSTDGFDFHIFRRHAFSGVIALLGRQDIEIGDPDFDRDFVIRSNSPEQAVRFLSNSRLRSLIWGLDQFQLEAVSPAELIVTPKPMSLILRIPGVVNDLNELRGCYELFGEAPDQLCKIGSVRPRL